MSRSIRRRTRVAFAAALGLAALTPSLASAVVVGPSATTATFVNFTAPAGIAEAAGEPTLGANWLSGRTMYQAFTETDQVTFNDAVFPATASWKNVSRPPTNVTSLDPILHTDEVTGRTLVSQLAPPCSIAAFTDSDGEPTATNPNGYTPSAACGVLANFDHQTVHFGKAVNPQLSPLYGPGRIAWYCSQVVAESACAVSRDGGITFEQSRPVYTFKGDLVTADQPLVGCEGLHGHLNTSPTDGTAYLPNFACNSASALAVNRPSVVVSPDEGVNWTIRQVPDGVSPNFDSDPAVDVDTANRAYVAYEDVESNLRVATTTDRGATFAPSQDLGAPFGLKNATFPEVIAGSAGRAAVAFLGTPAEAPVAPGKNAPENQLLAFDPDGNDPTGGWHAYVSLTYDGGVTWTTSDITPTDPVQRGCIFWGGSEGTGTACAGNKRNLLDFNDIAVDKFGRVLFGYADGCIGTCVTQGHTRNTNLTFANRETADSALTRPQFDELYSQKKKGVIARQSCGMGLFAEFDADPKGPLANPGCVAAAGGGNGLNPVVPEIPFVPLLLLAGAAAGGSLLAVRRRRADQAA